MPMPDGTPMNEYRARRDYFIGQALAGLCAKGERLGPEAIADLAIKIAEETIRKLGAVKSSPSPAK
jgi:hypothetical protein